MNKATLIRCRRQIGSRAHVCYFGHRRFNGMYLMAVAALCVSACKSTEAVQSRGGDPCALEMQASISLDIRGTVPVAAVMINGQPVRMIFDTGSEATLLSTDAIERLGVRFDFDRRATVQGIGPAMKSVLARIDKLELGGLALHGHALVVGGMLLPNLPSGQPDGLLGADIISAYDLDLDMPHRKVTLYRAPLACPDVKPRWKEAFLAIRGRRVGNKVVFPMELDGKVFAAAIDTGASAGVTIDRGAAIRAGIVFDEALASDKHIQSRGVTAEKVAVSLHRFNELKIGQEIIRDPLLPVASLGGGKVDALIGAAYLKHRHIWLSYATAQIFISAPP